MKTKHYKPPTPFEVFDTRTPLMLDVAVDNFMSENRESLAKVGPELVEYWKSHTIAWVLWFHANNPQWRAWLEGKRKRIDPRSQLRVWLEHWLNAFLLNPIQYRERHPMSDLGV